MVIILVHLYSRVHYSEVVIFSMIINARHTHDSAVLRTQILPAYPESRLTDQHNNQEEEINPHPSLGTVSSLA